ncbi:MAG: hypothetical protein MI919_38550 [Holophagales bacterium]|nr:hypothetical protein [Holophagales bacterium]
MSHFLLMCLYAGIISAFFALLSRRGFRRQLRLFAMIFGSLVGGALVLAWIMYFFPAGPPAPIP